MASSPPDVYKVQLANELQGLELPAYIIGALCASGGTFGYIKTGSIPSVTAGVTVGVLVRSNTPSTHPCLLTGPSTFWEDIASKTARLTEWNSPSTHQLSLLVPLFHEL